MSESIKKKRSNKISKSIVPQELVTSHYLEVMQDSLSYERNIFTTVKQQYLDGNGTNGKYD